jgi:NhaA family Na+:H+ antiporter
MKATKIGRPVPPTPAERILSPFRRFMQTESSGGIVLLLAAIIALIWANSPVWESYHHLWEQYLTFGFGEWEFHLSFHHFINDGLMVIFFFLVGLEIKREMMMGELASVRAAALPIAGAIGGMVAPAAIYVLVILMSGSAADTATMMQGWGIPMATDIAFALGILALMGPRIPLGLKVFLAALAIVDDLGAVLVIALFYTADLNLGALGIGALILLALVILNRLGVRRPLVYALMGLFLWAAFLASGVHATIAGVLLAMTVPARTRIDTEHFLEGSREVLDYFEKSGVEGESVLTNEGQQASIALLEDNCEKAQAPLVRIEHDLQLWVAFLIIPLFALANAGVHLAVDLGEALTNPVTLGVIFGLVLGKPVGITLASWLAVKAGLAALPKGVDWKAIHGVSWLGGIGFTMSLFVATLAFGEGSPLLDSAKIGILSASALAAIVGWVLLRNVGRQRA